jgi:uncharacterized protein (UPF0264 family)
VIPRLLVSVVAPDEVAAALAGGADIVDVKNPGEGPLGAATPAVLAAVRARVIVPVTLSAALGDAPLPGTLALAAAGAVACGADYVKLGLRGCDGPDAAVALLAAVRAAAQRVDPNVRVVAVAYADAERVGGLPPHELPAVARRAGAHGVMIDTAVKDGRSTLDLLGEPGVAAFAASARGLGLSVALAGGLRLADLPRLARLGVDVVGVRGAACVGGRGGTVSATRVCQLRDALALSASAFQTPARG